MYVHQVYMEDSVIIKQPKVRFHMGSMATSQFLEFGSVSGHVLRFRVGRDANVVPPTPSIDAEVASALRD